MDVQNLITCFDKSNSTYYDSPTAQKYRSMLMTESATGKVYSRGYDKEGRGILYLRPAKENTKDEDSQILNLVYHIERTIAATEKNGWEKMVIVQDFTGWTMKNAPPMSTTKKTIHILQVRFYLMSNYCTTFQLDVTEQRFLISTDLFVFRGFNNQLLELLPRENACKCTNFER